MEKKKGQILIITLLVLTILAIITVSLIVIVNKDVTQVVSTSKYEQSLNTAESQLNSVLEKYSKPGAKLSDITTDFAGGTAGGLSCTSGTANCSSSFTGANVYSCTANGSTYSTNGQNLSTQICAQDTNKITNYQIYKDRTFDVNLGGYSGILNFTWSKEAAIEFTLVYKDASGNYQSIKDVYDPPPTYTYGGLNGDQPNTDPNGIHPFPFAVDPGQDPNLSVQINIAGVLDLTGVPFSGTTVSLRVTPRMTTKLDSIDLSMDAVNLGLPLQMRNFESKSFDPNDNKTPIADVETKIPLNPQPDVFLDYGLITNGILTNN